MKWIRGGEGGGFGWQPTAVVQQFCENPYSIIRIRNSTFPAHMNKGAGFLWSVSSSFGFLMQNLPALLPPHPLALELGRERFPNRNVI